jgi:predicted N-formylglutamate amidohydrolase
MSAIQILPLLQPDEPSPVVMFNQGGRSAFVIVVDHAGREIPQCLNGLGVAPDELRRHIAWDIGALAVARHMSAILDAPLIAQHYSRLVIDCNRDPAVASSIPALSEYTVIPGNVRLTQPDAQRRCREIFEPYHQRIRELLDQRHRAGQPTMLVAQHSMTDCYKGERRPMHAAVLYNRDRRLAEGLLAALRRDASLQIAENEPYNLSDETDYTVPHHGEKRGLPHVEIEIRQDLVTDDAGQAKWGERLARALQAAQAVLGERQA